jgi:hypothetical protein
MRSRERHGAGVFTGLLFLALGVILLIGNMDLYPVRPLLSQWWPLLLVLIGVKHLIVFRGSQAWLGGFFWMATGALFLASTLGFVGTAVPTLVWPVVLIWFGVFTVLGWRGCGRAPREGDPS